MRSMDMTCDSGGRGEEVGGCLEMPVPIRK